VPKNRNTTLILGGCGLIGTALTEYLFHQEKKVITVDIKSFADEDLRQPPGTPAYNRILDFMKISDFVYFLAFDVGGAKFLDEKKNSLEFVKNNIAIMQNGFAMLEETGKPFIFTSSMWANFPHTVYGRLKLLGEAYTTILNGLSVRLWNVYGNEPKSLKSHVITDLICGALQGKKEIKLRSAGEEVRQFLYADDLSEVLELLRKNYDQIIKNQSVIDVSSGEWIQIKRLAKIISEHFDLPYSIGSVVDDNGVIDKTEPNLEYIKNLGFKTKISLEEGIKKVIDFQIKELQK